MNQKLLIVIVITLGFFVTLSVVLANYSNQKTHYDLNDLNITTDAEVISVLPSKDIQGFEIKIQAKYDGMLLMDDPLPYLQELYPDLGINSYWVVINDLGVNHFLENDKIRIEFKKNVELIQIVGFVPLN